MFHYVILLVSLLCSSGTTATPLAAADTVNLSAYQWHYRPLLVFAPSATDPRYRQQIQAVDAHRAGMTERDMVIGTFFENAPGSIDGTPVSIAATARLRQQFGVPAGQYMVVLIGKDGGVKLRSTSVVSIEELFALIDGMPMRQREVRERGR